MKWKFIVCCLTSFVFLGVANLSPMRAQSRDRPTFFREGEEFMDREIRRLENLNPNSVEHPSQLLSVEQNELRWHKYFFREGNFSIWMPQGNHSLEKITLDLGIGEANFEVWATHPPDSRFIAAYSDMLSPEILSQPEEAINLLAEAILERNSLNLISSEEIDFQEYPGKEFHVASESEIITFRIYLVKERFVVTAASQENTTEVSETVNDFLNSFRIL